MTDLDTGKSASSLFLISVNIELVSTFEFCLSSAMQIRSSSFSLDSEDYAIEYMSLWKY